MCHDLKFVKFKNIQKFCSLVYNQFSERLFTVRKYIVKKTYIDINNDQRKSPECGLASRLIC